MNVHCVNINIYYALWIILSNSHSEDHMCSWQLPTFEIHFSEMFGILLSLHFIYNYTILLLNR